MLHVQAEQRPSKSKETQTSFPSCFKEKHKENGLMSAVAVSDAPGVGTVTSETQTMRKEAGRERQRGQRGQQDGCGPSCCVSLARSAGHHPCRKSAGVGHRALSLPWEIPHVSHQAHVVQHWGSHSPQFPACQHICHQSCSQVIGRGWGHGCRWVRHPSPLLKAA